MLYIKLSIFPVILILFFCLSFFVFSSRPETKAKGFLSYPCTNCTNGICLIGGGGACGAEEVPDMSDIGISEEVRQTMIRNCDAYKGAAAEIDMPWQVLMAIHHREGSGNPDQSVKNGFRPLCNSQDSSCPAEICVPGDILLNDARCAVKILGDKAAMANSFGYSGDLAAPSDDFIKWVFYLYNGYTWETPDDRAYVMSRYPGSSVNDSRPGTFTIYAKLVGRF
jgi:hypothetical protein